MSESLDSVKRQFEEFLLADQPGRLARSEQLKSLLDSHMGDESGKEMVRNAIVESVIDMVITCHFMNTMGKK